jgi:hypothetical protein
MNSYKLVKIEEFPRLNINEHVNSVIDGSLPGFTREPKTKITYRNESYYGFKYFEIEHEMMIKDSGIAFGFIDDRPQTMNFINYLKRFTIKCFYLQEEKYAFLSAPSDVTTDVIRAIRDNKDMSTKVSEYLLDMQKLREHVREYMGAWFKGVSTRVNSTALFGSDLVNDPLYDQLMNDGALLTSVFIPYRSMTIQLNDKAGISSRQTIDNISDELDIVNRLLKFPPSANL